MQPVTAIHHVAGVDQLAAVCDGNLLLLDPDSLKEWHVPGAKVRCDAILCLSCAYNGPKYAAFGKGPCLTQ